MIGHELLRYFSTVAPANFRGRQVKDYRDVNWQCQAAIAVHFACLGCVTNRSAATTAQYSRTCFDTFRIHCSGLPESRRTIRRCEAASSERSRLLVGPWLR